MDTWETLQACRHLKHLDTCTLKPLGHLKGTCTLKMLAQFGTSIVEHLWHLWCSWFSRIKLNTGQLNGGKNHFHQIADTAILIGLPSFFARGCQGNISVSLLWRWNIWDYMKKLARKIDIKHNISVLAWCEKEAYSATEMEKKLHLFVKSVEIK